MCIRDRGNADGRTINSIRPKEPETADTDPRRKEQRKMFCRNQLTVCKRKCFFQQPWLFFIKSEILKSDDLKNMSECCLSLKTGGMDGKKKRDNR